jgi:DNA-binding transcriptional ArsR family regulator
MSKDFSFTKHKNCEKILEMFSLFSNELRFKTLCLLTDGDYCVNDIVDAIGGKHSNVSQQLKMLTMAGYLSRERKGKQVFYHLEIEKLKDVVKDLQNLFKK